MAGRKSKYTPELQKQITDVLASGATIRDACAHVGISEKTYFEWMNSPSKGEFREATTYAQQQARLSAVLAIKQAVRGVQQTSHTTESFTETRTRLNKAGEVVPYDYQRTATKQTVTNLAPDWRAAVEYLKRRDPEHWSERQQIDMNIRIDPNLLKQFIEATERMGWNAGDVLEDFVRQANAAEHQRVQSAVDSQAHGAADGA